jgi:ribosomal protein L11 methyltransferase
LFQAGTEAIQETELDLVAHFPPDAPTDAIRDSVVVADPRATVAFSESPGIDWGSWRADVSAHAVGSMTVAPPWLAMDPLSDKVVVVDPAMAFGTGEHATTRACLGLLQIAAPDGKRVADLGTGSGVLAIAAAKLGAERVVGIEIDPDAIPNAEANVVLNGVSDRVTIIEGDAKPLLLLLRPFDLILANILSSVIRELFDAMDASLSPSGVAILSGILDEESDDMKLFVAARGWIIESESIEDRWWSGLIARR